jgi:hypothetical protein
VLRGHVDEPTGDERMDGTSFVQLGVLSAEALERLVRAREAHNSNERKGPRFTVVSAGARPVVEQGGINQSGIEPSTLI